MRVFRAMDHQTRRKVTFAGRVGEFVFPASTSDEGYVWIGLETGLPCGAVAAIGEADISPVELARMKLEIEPVSVLAELGWIQQWAPGTVVVSLTKGGEMERHVTDETAARELNAEWARTKRAAGRVPVIVWKPPGWYTLALTPVERWLGAPFMDMTRLLEHVRTLPGFRRATAVRLLTEGRT